MKAIACILSLLSFPAFSSPKLEANQVWSYDARPGEEASALTILKLEKQDGKSIVHIRVDGVKVKNPQHRNGVSDFIAHMPFAEDALKKSLRQKLKSREKLPDFSAGYAQWKTAKGGVFTIAVKDAVAFIEQTLSK